MPGEARVREDGWQKVSHGTCPHDSLKGEANMGKVKFRQKTRVLSGREARRYGEREREREQRRADPERFWQLPPEERARRLADSELAQRIQRNGITLEDLIPDPALRRQAEDFCVSEDKNRLYRKADPDELSD